MKPLYHAKKIAFSIFIALLFLSGIFSAQNARAQVSQNFTANGTFVIPAGVTSITVECWGAGGGGGSASLGSVRCGGGAGGAYARSVISVIPSASYPVAVGIGGSAAIAGGNSTFNTNTVVAAGGKGGVNNLTTAGTPALITASIGSTKFIGGKGAAGSSYSGGGGGAAGLTGAGGNAIGMTAGAGVAPNGGSGGAGVTNNTNGKNGANYGGGGSGGSRTSSGTRIGGVGANGLVRVTWTCPIYLITSTTAASPVTFGTPSIVTLTSNTLSNATYMVTYDLSGANNSIGNYAYMVFANGTGTFNTGTILNPGATTITITHLAIATCSCAITANNTDTFTAVFIPNTAIFPTNGTFIVPPGITSLSVDAWGGGGAGGGSTNAATAQARGGAGGGGGAFAHTYIPVTPGDTLTIIVAGTTPGTTGNNGNPGAHSTIVDYETQILATGGSGGFGNITGGSPAGGIGGAIAACAGTALYAGFSGGNGAEGINITSGFGGDGANAGGAGGPGLTPAFVTSTGIPGNGPSGGGGGARTFQAEGPQGGGTGGPGLIIIKWTPCITPAVTMATTTSNLCQAGLEQTVTLAYSNPINSPISYSITWNALPANSIAAVNNETLPLSPISITVPANTPAGTYTGTITVKNAMACISSSADFSLNVYLPDPATFSSPPSNNTVACGTSLVASSLNYQNAMTGNCLISGSATSSFSTMPGACGGIVTETWSATDPFGRTIPSVSRTITVSPASLPTMTAPADITVDCGNLPVASTLSFSNGASGACSISGDSDLSTFTATPGVCGGTVTETWTATDLCGRGISTVSRVISVLPAALPTMSASADITVDCGGIPAPSTINYDNGLSGNCNITGLSDYSTFTATPDVCGGQVTETWTATDNCSRTITSVSRTITVNAATLPTMTTPADITLSLNAVFTASTRPYSNGLTGNCAISGTSDLSYFTQTPDEPSGNGIETWTATDICGRALVSVHRHISNIGIEGNYTIGTGGNYPNFTGPTGLFKAINDSYVSDNIIASVIGNITEPGIYGLNEWIETGTGGYTLLIRSSAAVARILQGNVTNSLFRLNGADRVTFDGLVAGSGTIRFLTLRNTNTAYPSLGISNGSTNLLINGCNLEGGNSNVNSGVVVIGTAGITSGNTNITFSGNLFQPVSTIPANLLYSSGTAGLPNENINLNTNEFRNFRLNGIHVTTIGNGNSWLINQNVFYNNTAPNTAQICINFIPGISSTLNQVNNNTIGGNTKTNTGIWTNSGAITFKAICVNSGFTEIKSNIVQNITLSNVGQTNFIGVDLLGGPANISNNIIGSIATANSIRLSGLCNFFGLKSASLAEGINVNENQIANITSTLATGYPNLYGIYISAGSIFRNKIYNMGSSTTGSLLAIFGIELNGSPGLTAKCYNNMISLNGGSSLNPKIFGIQDNASSASATMPLAQYAHNSVEITGSATTINKTYAFQRNFNGVVEIKNNIFSNKRTTSIVGHYAIGTANTTGWTANNNNLYVSSTWLGFWSAGNYTNMTAWRAASGQDASSISVLPAFVAPTNLHLTASNPLLYDACPLLAWVSDDFDGDARGLGLVTYGADENLPIVKMTTEIINSASLNIIPNPFTSNVQLVVNVSSESRINLSIYNILGEKIRDIAEENLPAGSKTYSFTADNLPSGLYLCRMFIKNDEKTELIVKRIIKD